MSRRTAFLLLSLALLESTPYAHAHPLLADWFRRVAFAVAEPSSSASDGGWLWGWGWGVDSIVSVVDRSPPVNFASRPASFGPLFDEPLLGYAIPMASFTVPCKGDKGDRRRKRGVQRGGGFENRNGNWSTKFEDRHTVDEPPVKNIGCPKLCLKGRREPTESWIAIVQRGECQFVDKVREAQGFGARGVVVGGDDPEVSGNPDALVNMYSQGDASDVEIPSTFIKYTDYMRLARIIATSNTSTSGIRTVSLQITVDYSSWEWYSPILTFIVLLLLPSSITLVTLLIHRVRLARAARRERAPEDVVNNLPWRVWTGSGWEKHEGPVPKETGTDTNTIDLERGEGEGNVGTDTEQEPGVPSTSHEQTPWFEAQSECAICLSEFVKGDRVRVLPCQHIFHVEEIDEWLIHRKKLCPVCKSDVTQPHPPPPPPHSPRSPHPPTGEMSPSSSPYPHPPSPPRESSQASSPTERTPLLQLPDSSL